MLILLLKTIHVLDERQFATLAAASGCHPDSLTRVLRRLARHMEPNRNRLAMLRERRNQAFVLCQLWAATAFVETDPQKLARAQQNLERYRTTLVRSREELARVRTAPSNRMIADVLGLSKGTVETGLRTLRERIPTRYRPRDGVGSGQQQSP